MGECNTVVSAYTLYRHLQQYCSHPSIYVELTFEGHYTVCINTKWKIIPDNSVSIAEAVFPYFRFNPLPDNRF